MKGFDQYEKCKCPQACPGRNPRCGMNCMLPSVHSCRSFQVCPSPAFHQYTGRSLLRSLVCCGNGFYHKSSEKSHGNRNSSGISWFHVRRPALRPPLPLYSETSHGIPGRTLWHFCHRRNFKLSNSYTPYGRLLCCVCFCSSLLCVQLWRNSHCPGTCNCSETYQSSGYLSGKTRKAEKRPLNHGPVLP